MRQAVVWSALLVMLSFLLTLAVVGMQAIGEEPVQPEPEQTAAVPVPADTQVTLLLKDGDQIQKITMGDYLLGVLCCEMPLQFEPAALEAQAVASRTFTLYQCQRGKHAD